MAKFKFNLHALLKQRQHAEQEKQRQLAEKQAVVNELSAQMRKTNADVAAAMDAMRQHHLVGKLDLSLLAAHRRYLGHMKGKLLEGAQRLTFATKARDEARAALAEAAVARKTIEKLREKAFERWKSEQDRKETAQLDEVGMQLAYAEASNPADVERADENP